MKKAVLLLSSVPQELTRMKFNRTPVNSALLVISVTVKTILVISQAITVQMGFIVPMEQDMPLSLAAQMEHMVMVPTSSILINVSSAHLEDSVMVRIISNTRDSVSLRYPNTEKRVENKMCSGVFLTKFEVFGWRMKHCLACSIETKTKE